ncbi:MAG: response regulator [Desulfuromonadales bacterium]|nr:response regulator [Desulfuromonadales bacterium]
MRTPPLILIVEDNSASLDILQTRLKTHNYDVITATDGEEGLVKARKKQPDLILLDIMLPKMDGMEVCRRLKGDPSLPFIPIIMVTAKADSKDVVAGLEAGGDEYLSKPVDHAALVARVKSMLRIKELHDTVCEQSGRLKEQSAQLAEWNQVLEQRVEQQLTELEQVGRLRRFLSPQIAELIVSSEDKRLLESHRNEIAVVFCDLRGFTAFSETCEPEEVMGVLREYHSTMGTLIFRFEGTLERFTGDGLMVFFNDPLPCPDPAARAVRMALEMRKLVGNLSKKWRKRDHQLDFGVGIAQGYATLGKIGFEGRFDYAAIGTVTNLASRLCDKAQAGQVLISQRVYSALEELVHVEPVGALTLKGLQRPVTAYNVLYLKNEPTPS